MAPSAALVRIEDEPARSSSKRDADVESIRRETVSTNLRLATVAGDVNLMKGLMGTFIAGIVAVIFPLRILALPPPAGPSLSR